MSEALPEPIIKIDETKCVGDGICVEICPQQNLELVKVGVKRKVRVKDINMCVVCRYCQKVCPHGAIKVELPGYELW